MMYLIGCYKCGKRIAQVDIPWDAGGGETYYCLKCKPLTTKQKEDLEYAEWKKKKEKVLG